jgi:hypothetical protein
VKICKLTEIADSCAPYELQICGNSVRVIMKMSRFWPKERCALHNSSGVRPGANPRHLVVDDDRDLCHLVAQYFEPEGFTLSIVHTGVEGVRAAIEGHHELVVLDVMLPDKRDLMFCGKSGCASARLFWCLRQGQRIRSNPGSGTRPRWLLAEAVQPARIICAYLGDTPQVRRAI